MNTKKHTLLIVYLLMAVIINGQNSADKEKIWREDVKGKLQSNKPIDFYGQILDQVGQPVQGIKVGITVFSWFDEGGKGDDYDQREEDYTLISDAQGRFELHGKIGTGIEMELRHKSGYFFDLNAKKIFNYDPTERGALHKPVSQNPVIFRVWKAQGGETVVKWDARGRSIPQDGTFVAVDLLDHQFRNGDSLAADFRVAVKREMPPNAKHNRSDKYRWSVQIAAVDGGIASTEDEYMYLAPENGYQPAAEYVFDPSDPNWSYAKEFRFYVRSGGGKNCARVVLYVGSSTELPTALIEIQSAINLTGSRNLEEGKVLPYLPNTR